MISYYVTIIGTILLSIGSFIMLTWNGSAKKFGIGYKMVVISLFVIAATSINLMVGVAITVALFSLYKVGVRII